MKNLYREHSLFSGQIEIGGVNRPIRITVSRGMQGYTGWCAGAPDRWGAPEYYASVGPGESVKAVLKLVSPKISGLRPIIER